MLFILSTPPEHACSNWKTVRVCIIDATVQLIMSREAEHTVFVDIKPGMMNQVLGFNRVNT